MGYQPPSLTPVTYPKRVDLNRHRSPRPGDSIEVRLNYYFPSNGTLEREFERMDFILRELGKLFDEYKRRNESDKD